MALRCIIRDRAHASAEFVFHSVFERSGRFWLKVAKAKAEDFHTLPVLSRNTISDMWLVDEAEYRIAVLFQQAKQITNS